MLPIAHRLSIGRRIRETKSSPEVPAAVSQPAGAMPARAFRPSTTGLRRESRGASLDMADDPAESTTAEPIRLRRPARGFLRTGGTMPHISGSAPVALGLVAGERSDASL